MSLDLVKVCLFGLFGTALLGARFAARKFPEGYIAAFFTRLDNSTPLTIAFCLIGAALYLGLLFAWKAWRHKVSARRCSS